MGVGPQAEVTSGVIELRQFGCEIIVARAESQQVDCVCELVHEDALVEVPFPSKATGVLLGRRPQWLPSRSTQRPRTPVLILAVHARVLWKGRPILGEPDDRHLGAACDEFLADRRDGRQHVCHKVVRLLEGSILDLA